MDTAGTLYWKWEDGPPDATDDDSTAVGPAWVVESERHSEGV